MIENILVFIIISVLVYSSSKERAIGWLVLSYYAVYIIIALDYFGPVTETIFTTYSHFTAWYLIYTAISSVFFVFALIEYSYSKSRVAFFYAAWIIFNMLISGLSAIFQSYETNAMLWLYNSIQNMNLLVDIIVVMVGTDNKIRRTKYVSGIIDSANSYIDIWIDLAFKVCNRNK